MTPAARFSIPANHPSLPGHFPGRPVVPGVVLLDLILDAAAQACPGWRVAGLPTVKFLRPVLPGQEVVIRLQPAAERMGVSCTVDGQEVLRGTLALVALEAAREVAPGVAATGASLAATGPA